jgi:hypothetical protein
MVTDCRQLLGAADETRERDGQFVPGAGFGAFRGSGMWAGGRFMRLLP